MKKAGLYIHIPFCRSKCPYCGFYSITSQDVAPDFLKALSVEMKLYKKSFRAFDTLYIGGGTPSLLSVQDIGAILEGAAATFVFSSQAEITLEANPADLNLSCLEALRSLGINRVNLGIQSFDDNVLAFLGRRHNRSQAVSALKAVGDAGFDNWGLDLIYGVPGQEISQWLETLHMALSFHPAHLSCYQLTVEPDTPLGLSQLQGKVLLPDEEELANIFYATSDTLKKAGYIHYEVSNFAKKPKFLSRHNQKYWDHTPYLGLGPAAHSFDGHKRWWNHRDAAAYIRGIGKGVPPIEASEMLTDEELRLEALFLGLRTSRGIDLRNYRLRYGCDLLSEKADKISILTDEGMIEIKNGRLKPTLAGFAVADSLALL